MTKDYVNPDHYKQYPVECIEVIELMTNPLLANVVKYMWRLGDKDNPEQEKAKALWYLNRYKSNNYSNATEPLIPIRVYAVIDNKLKSLREHMDNERLATITGLVELNYRSKVSNRILLNHVKQLIENFPV